MSKFERYAFLIWIVFSLFAVKVVSQQQYSGGQSVTITNASLAVTQSGTWNARLQDGSGNAITSTASALDINVKSGSIANTAFGVNAGTAKIGIVYPYTGCGTTQAEQALQAMPTISTAIFSSTTCVVTFVVSNTTGGSLNVTLSDNAGSPVNYWNAVTLTAGESRQLNSVQGIKFTSGVKVLASGAGVTYYALGLQ